MKKLTKVLAAVMACMMVFGAMVVSTFAADDEYTCGIAGQFNTDYAGNFDEWADTSSFNSTFKADGSTITYKVDFGQMVEFSGNYVGLQTNVPVTKDADDKITNVAKLISVKLDGTEVPVTGTILTAEGFDGGLRINITNAWNSDITTQPVASETWATTPFQVIEVQFSVGEAAATSDSTAGDSATTALVIAAVAALAVVATVSTKKFAVEK